MHTGPIRANRHIVALFSSSSSEDAAADALLFVFPSPSIYHIAKMQIHSPPSSALAY